MPSNPSLINLALFLKVTSTLRIDQQQLRRLPGDTFLWFWPWSIANSKARLSLFEYLQQGRAPVVQSLECHWDHGHGTTTTHGARQGYIVSFCLHYFPQILGLDACWMLQPILLIYICRLKVPTSLLFWSSFPLVYWSWPISSRHIQ